MKRLPITLFCILLIIIFLAKPLPAKEVSQPFVNIAKGDVTVKPGQKDSWMVAEEGRILYGMDMVRTGQESRAELSAPSGTLRLYQNTLMTIPEIYTGTDGTRNIRSLNLESGTGIFNIKKRGRKNKFAITSKHVVAVVKGTIFAIRRIDNESVVACLFGKVVVSPKNKAVTARSISLGPGEVITFEEDIGFGEKQFFNSTIGIWKRWKNHFDWEDLSSSETFLYDERDENRNSGDCPPEDVLWD